MAQRYLRRYVGLVVALCLLLVGGQADAMRSKKPQTLTDLEDINQLSELNLTLEALWNITNGRYTLENILIDPEGVRKGVAGDLVYASFGSQDHLCINRSASPGGTDWTCINIGTLSTCPGGLDTQVQFNDNGECGGDAGFLFEKNHDHASLGPDAEINATLPFPSALPGAAGGDTEQTFLIRETEPVYDSAEFAGLVADLTLTPDANTEGFIDSFYSGVMGTISLTGTSTSAFTGSIMSSVSGIAEVSLTGTADVFTSGTLNAFYGGLEFDSTNTGSGISGQSLNGLNYEALLNVNSGTLGGSMTGARFWYDIGALTRSGSVRGVDVQMDINSGAPTFLVTGSTTGNRNLITTRALHRNNEIIGTLNSLTVQGNLDDSDIVGSDITIVNSATDIDTTKIMGEQIDVTSQATATTHNAIHGVRIDDIDLLTSNGAVLVTNLSAEGMLMVNGSVGTFANLDLVEPVDAGTGSITNAYAIRMEVPSVAGAENFGLYAREAVSGIIVAEGLTDNIHRTFVDFEEPARDVRILLPNVTGVVVLHTTQFVGRATCWTTERSIGYCSSAVDASGNCTCN